MRPQLSFWFFVWPGGYSLRGLCCVLFAVLRLMDPGQYCDHLVEGNRSWLLYLCFCFCCCCFCCLSEAFVASVMICLILLLISLVVGYDL